VLVTRPVIRDSKCVSLSLRLSVSLGRDASYSKSYYGSLQEVVYEESIGTKFNDLDLHLQEIRNRQLIHVRAARESFIRAHVNFFLSMFVPGLRNILCGYVYWFNFVMRLHCLCIWDDDGCETTSIFSAHKPLL